MSTQRNNILITGASSGLGAGMAREFARRGKNLALCARRLDRLEELASELRSLSADIQVIVKPLDVDDHDAVFEVFGQCDAELGGLDRVIVNAGIMDSRRIGTGHFPGNRKTAATNFVSALAQCEAAMEIFYARNAGHLVVISSMSAMSPLRGSMAVYAASKAGVAALAEGIAADVNGKPIKVTTLYPGYIRTELNERINDAPFIVDLESGCRDLTDRIEAEVAAAAVPRFPWAPMGFAMKHLPRMLMRRLI